MDYSRQKNEAYLLYITSGIFIIIGHLLQYTSTINTLDYPFTLLYLQIAYGFIFFISGYLCALEMKNRRSESSLKLALKNIAYIYPLYLLAISSYALLGFIDKTTFIHGATLLSIFRTPPLPTLWFATIIILLTMLTPALHYIQNKKSRTVYYVLLSLSLIAILTFYKLIFQALDIRIVLYLPSFIGGFYLAQNRVRGSTCLGLLILAAVFYLLPLKKGYFEIISTAPLIFMVPAFTMVLLNTFLRQVNSRREITITYKTILCALLFYRVIFYGIINIFFPAKDPYSFIYLALICLPSILLISYVIQRTYSVTYNKIMIKDHAEHKTIYALFFSTLVFLIFTYSFTSSHPKVPADYKNKINHEMITLANRLMSIKINPYMQYSYALMEKGVLQNTDRRYTYDYIPESIKGGYLFQGIHRTPRGTSFNFKVHEPLKIFFFFHTRLDGGYGSVFPKMARWQKENDVPMYDIYNGDHGRSITMYSAEFAPGSFTLPETTSKDACIGFVVKAISQDNPL